MRLAEFLRLQLTTRFSGSVLLHFQNGHVRLIEVPKDRFVIREDFDKAEVRSVESTAAPIHS